MWASVFVIVTVKSILLCCENIVIKRAGGGVHSLRRYPVVHLKLLLSVRTISQPQTSIDPLHLSSNGAPWARPGAMPRGPKWGVLILRPPKKRAQGQLPIFDFLT